MSQLTAFVGVTGLVLSGFLVLARLSQRVVDDVEDAERDEIESAATPARRQTPEQTTESTDTATPRADAPGADAPVTRSVEQAASREGVAETPRSPAAPGDDPTAGEVDEREPALARADSEMESLSPGMLLANVALTQGLFGGILAAAAWYFRVPGDVLGLWGGSVAGTRAVAVGVAFGVALWVANELASAFADAAGATYDEGLREMLAPANARGWALLLGATLPIIALVEEFLFRAAAVGAASAALPVSPWALAVVSSAGFALGHGAQGRVGVVVTGALGMVLAAGYVLTGSFVVVVVAHYLVNALEFGLHEGLGLPDPIWS